MTEQTSGGQPQQQQTLKVSTLAFVKMIMHAVRNPNDQVHGILVGRYYTKQAVTGPILSIQDAIPVCHSAPTKPLLDMAFRLTETHCFSSKIPFSGSDAEEEKVITKTDCVIVGWYSVNERMDDTQPSQSALRIIGSIAARQLQYQSESAQSILPPHSEPVLILVSNPKLGSILKDEEMSSDEHALDVYGRDSRKYWLRPVPKESMSVATDGLASEGAAAMVKAVCRLDTGSIPFHDFENHLEAAGDQIKKTDWIRNSAVVQFLRSQK